MLAAGARVDLVRVARDTFRETLEVNGILIAVGALVQVMAANGVRGLFVISSISVPVYVLYVAIFVVCVFLGGVLGPFAVASVFGIPFMLALLGRDPIMATVALSLLACVSSVTPPTAILGKSAMILADCRDSYWSFLRVSACRRWRSPWLAWWRSSTRTPSASCASPGDGRRDDDPGGLSLLCAAMAVLAVWGLFAGRHAPAEGRGGAHAGAAGVARAADQVG